MRQTLIALMFLPSFSLAAGLIDGYNNPDLDPEKTADRVVAFFKKKAKVAATPEALEENFVVQGNAKIDEAKVLFFPNDHVGLGSLHLLVKAVGELLRPGDVILVEDIDIDFDTRRIDRPCRIFLNTMLFAMPFDVSQILVKYERYQPVILRKVQDYNRQQPKAKIRVEELWDVASCHGWDREEYLQTQDRLMSSPTSAKDALPLFGLKNRAKDILPMIKSLPRELQVLALASAARNLTMLQAIKRHLKKGNRVFVIAGFAHVPHAESWVAASKDQKTLYEASIQFLQPGIEAYPYVALFDKKPDSAYFVELYERQKKAASQLKDDL